MVPFGCTSIKSEDIKGWRMENTVSMYNNTEEVNVIGRFPVAHSNRFTYECANGQ
jgi:hypothetical protein